MLCCVVLCRVDFLPPPVCAQTLPSDGDSLSSPPRMHRGSQAQCVEGQQEEALQVLSKYLIFDWMMPVYNTPNRIRNNH